ncbi:MAG: type I-G CRISPR-associated helicase/endonuclease Cas3g [Gemmatimonadaceae bacterium]
MQPTSFDALFRHATAEDPFPFQRRFGESPDLPPLVRIPTGLGKTAMMVLGWLWRRQCADDGIRKATPRRLVYCLPMRVLVEQTRSAVRHWLQRLGLEAEVTVSVLMGGEEPENWDSYPERDTILIGTQDMLLSRALNRGYSMTRYRWPMHFALLNNDCLWAFDEIQLMGTGLATTAQLHAFRGEDQGLGTCGSVQSIWMSATLDPGWLRTVDSDPATLGRPLELGDDDLAIKEVSERYGATKLLGKAAATSEETASLATEILDAHRPGTRTLVVVNTVERARRLHKELHKARATRKASATLVLLHSRFRPADRQTRLGQLLEDPLEAGTIIVSTQVVEAGVDVSARMLFTELAPWASLVQRFGRCNRRGEFTSAGDPARVIWVDIPPKSKGSMPDQVGNQKAARPYTVEDLERARGRLVQLDGSSVGLAALAGLDTAMSFRHAHVIRRKDIVELFDTTPDLAGNDVDIDRYVRDLDDSDVRVFWRDLGAPAEPDEELPVRDELCPAPIGSFRKFVAALANAKQTHLRDRRAYRRNFLQRRWERVGERDIYPGQIYLLDATAGGYAPDAGWTGEVARSPEHRVAPLRPAHQELSATDAGTEDDPFSRVGVWQSIAEHTDDVCRELDAILVQLEVPNAEVLRIAARWHDLGKAHHVFQAAVRDEHPTHGPRPAPRAGRRDIAKAPGEAKSKDGAVLDPGWWARYQRRHFRHELASSLAVLQLHELHIPRGLRDLVAYLVAAHHGKVRLSIRSLPGENRPVGDHRYARGVWDGEELPAVELGGTVTSPRITLSLEPMELGCSADGEPSWVDRVLRLRDELGVFRLAYLEALLRAADMRASEQAAR